MAEKKKIQFSLKAINTNQFATIKDVYSEEETVSLTTAFNFGINKEENSVMIVFKVSFDSGDKPFILLEVGSEFDIYLDSFNSFINKKTQQVKIPKGLLTHFIVLTIGTARGILHEKLKTTDFKDFLLPTIDVSELIEEDVTFE